MTEVKEVRSVAMLSKGNKECCSSDCERVSGCV
jgi:hypothetical protein